MNKYDLLYRMAFHPLYLYDINDFNKIIDKVALDPKTGLNKDKMDLDDFFEVF